MMNESFEVEEKEMTYEFSIILFTNLIYLHIIFYIALRIMYCK